MGEICTGNAPHRIQGSWVGLGPNQVRVAHCCARGNKKTPQARTFYGQEKSQNEKFLKHTSLFILLA